MDTTDLEYRLSGGAGNSDPDASLGGIKSSTKVLTRSGSFSTMTGITIVDVIGIPTDDVIFYSTGFDYITFATEDGNFGDYVNVPTNDRYVLYTASGDVADGYAIVDVVTASLPASGVEEVVTTTRLSNKIFDDISNTEATAGHTDYRCIYFHNAHASQSLAYVSLFIEQNLPEADYIQVGLDPAGIGNGSTTGVATTIATELLVPSGVTFSSPTEASPLLTSGTIVAGNGFAVWIKRVVPTGIVYSSTDDAFILGFQAFVVLP